MQSGLAVPIKRLRPSAQYNEIMPPLIRQYGDFNSRLVFTLFNKLANRSICCWGEYQLHGYKMSLLLMLMTLSVIHVNGKTQPINSQLWHLVRNWFRPMFSANESLFWYIISARRNFLKGANEPGFIMSKIFDFQMTIFSHTLVYVSVSIQTIWTVWRFNILTFNESTLRYSLFIFLLSAQRGWYCFR